MKKITLLILLFLLAVATPAIAVNYYTDVLEAGNPGGWTESEKTFDEESTIFPGDQFEVDIWIHAGPGEAASGGFWIDFAGSTDKVAYVQAERYNKYYNEGELPGPWSPGGVIVNEPLGAGTLLVQVINLGGAEPDVYGDIIIAKVTFQCIAQGDVQITVVTYPEIHFWATIPPWDDSVILPAILTIHQEYECNVDADCVDRLWCTGTEVCVDHRCNEGIPPCDDEEECSMDKCREADPHCGSDLNCEAIEGLCKHYCNAFSGTEPCMMYPICYTFGCYDYQGDHFDYDCDSIEDDGDGNGIWWDHPCMNGQTENCDDNCWMDKNSTQADQGDGDGAGDACDNCLDTPNGPYGGTCTKGAVGSSCLNHSDCGAGGSCSMDQEDNDKDGWGDVCDPDDDNDAIPDSEDNCPFIPSPDQNDSDTDGVGDLCENCLNIFNPYQEDTYPPDGNEIGDACDCEGNFDCDQDIDAGDVTTFLQHFGRSQYNNPCTNQYQCKGDFSCDGDVDAQDVTKFLEDFGRSQYNNPCPVCEAGGWCSY